MRDIPAGDLVPGDLVYSSRTQQLMLILSSNTREGGVEISWLPLVDGKSIMIATVKNSQVFTEVR
jgi:hypothetical protein